MVVVHQRGMVILPNGVEALPHLILDLVNMEAEAEALFMAAAVEVLAVEIPAKLVETAAVQMYGSKAVAALVAPMAALLALTAQMALVCLVEKAAAVAAATQQVEMVAPQVAAAAAAVGTINLAALVGQVK